MYDVLIRFFAIVALATTLSSLPAPVQAIARKGELLPALQVTSISGQRVSTASYAGKVLLVAISASFCSQCSKGIPRLERMQKLYEEQGFQVQGAIYGPGFGLEELKKYIEKNKVGYPLALTDSAAVRSSIGITFLPLYLLLDRKGSVVGIYRGFSEQNMLQIEREVRRLLAV
jgi:glutathione peroxidase-family protein